MTVYKGNTQLTNLLINNYNLEKNPKWYKFVKRRGYNTLKYGFFEPLNISDITIKYTEFRNITSYCSELAHILLKYILISERRLINSMINIFEKRSNEWHNPLVYDYDSKPKLKNIKNFISKTQQLIDYDNIRFKKELDKYKYINLWTISEYFTFGNIKSFWNITDTNFKHKWNNKYGLSKNNKVNQELTENFSNTIYNFTKESKNNYRTLDTIGIINKNLKLLNDCRNSFAHNESILNKKIDLINLIAVLSIFLQKKEINKLSKEIIFLNKNYLRNNNLFNNISKEKKDLFSIDSNYIELLKKRNFTTKW